MLMHVDKACASDASYACFHFCSVALLVDMFITETEAACEFPLSPHAAHIDFSSASLFPIVQAEDFLESRELSLRDPRSA